MYLFITDQCEAFTDQPYSPTLMFSSHQRVFLTHHHINTKVSLDLWCGFKEMYRKGWKLSFFLNCAFIVQRQILTSLMWLLRYIMFAFSFLDLEAKMVSTGEQLN